MSSKPCALDLFLADTIHTSLLPHNTRLTKGMRRKDMRNESEVRPLSSFESMSALPVSSSSMTMSAFLFWAAHKSGVRLLLSFKLTSALPESSSSSNAAAFFFRVANKSGVRPPRSFELTSALPISSSSLSIAVYPIWAAHHSGVLPSLSLSRLWPYLSQGVSGLRSLSRSK
jgi:hypothetical protein